MTDPTVALDLQGELYRFWSGPNGRGAMEGAARLMERDGRYAQSGLTPDRMRQTHVIESDRLRRADPYWVDSDMVRLTEHASHSMEAETLEEVDLPTPAGFVLMEHPVRGMFYNGPEAARELEVPEDPPLAAFSWDLAGGMCGVTGYTVTAAINPKSFGWPRVMILNQHSWPLGHDNPVDEQYLPCHRFYKTFWALCQQRIGRAELKPADRHGRRRAERAGLESLVGVRVVTLRRRSPSSTAGEGGPAEWSCRWVVEGHWRQQWYPSMDTHRQIWIEAYEKGPEDAPLKLKDRVYRLAR